MKITSGAKRYHGREKETSDHIWLQPGDETTKTNVEDVSGRSGVRVETTWEDIQQRFGAIISTRQQQITTSTDLETRFKQKFSAAWHY